jgi:tetratricopeptide (TPR) repeat protein
VNPAVVNPVVNPAAANPALANPANPGEPKPRVPANDEALKRAFKFIDFGDQLFADQKFLEAYQRYQSAATAAHDLSDANFRRGFALTALGQYDRAADAFKRGLVQNPEWSKSPFKLDDLYRDNRIAKEAHQQQLATLLEKDPQNVNAMFVLGVLLYFDDQRERSSPFLKRAFALMQEPANNPAANNPAANPAHPNPPADAGKPAPRPPARPDEIEI